MKTKNIFISLLVLLCVSAVRGQELSTDYEGLLCLKPAHDYFVVFYGTREEALAYESIKPQQPSEPKLLILNVDGSGGPYGGRCQKVVFLKQADGTWKRKGFYVPLFVGNGQYRVLKSARLENGEVIPITQVE